MGAADALGRHGRLESGTVDVAETVVDAQARLLFGPPKIWPGRRRIGFLAAWSTSWRYTCER